MIKQLFSYVVYGLLFTALLLVLPISDAFVFDTKKALLFVAGLAVLIMTAVQLWKQKTLELTFSPIAIALTLFGATVLVSTFLSGTYPYEALFGWGGIFLMTTVIAGLGHELLSKKVAEQVPLLLCVASAGLAIITILQTFGYGPSHLYNSALKISLPNTAIFNMAESSLVAIEVFLIAIISGIALLMRKKNTQPQSIVAGILAVTLAGLAITTWATFSNPDTKIVNALPLDANLAIARSVLSSPKTALIGMGPNSFAHAYNTYKPATINDTSVWGIEFGNGVNVPLTLVVTTGVLGLAAWVLLVFLIVKQVLRHSELVKEPLTWGLLTAIAMQLLFPPSVVVMTLFGLLLAAWLTAQAHRFEKVKMHTLITRLSPDYSKAASVSVTHLISRTLSVSMVVFVILSLYGSARAFASSYYMFRSTQVFNTNGSAGEVYEFQRKAVAMNPFIDTNRRRYALTNLAIAQALAAKPDLLEAEREQALQLIQQAIREARAAATLQPEDARNWETLGVVYQNLTGVATGADQWAVNSFSRAIETDPANPGLWFQLGTTFYQNGQFAEATRVFAYAVELKRDYLNAQYSLANSLQKNQQLAEAKVAYEQLLTQLTPTSAEYSLVVGEMDALEKLMAAPAKSATPSAQTTPTTSVVEEGLTPVNSAVPSQNESLSDETKQYLDTTPLN